jgi:hypothetical protein
LHRIDIRHGSNIVHYSKKIKVSHKNIKFLLTKQKKKEKLIYINGIKLRIVCCK